MRENFKIITVFYKKNRCYLLSWNEFNFLDYNPIFCKTKVFFEKLKRRSVEEEPEIKVDKRKKKQYNVLTEKEKASVGKWGIDKKKIWKYVF